MDAAVLQPARRRPDAVAGAQHRLVEPCLDDLVELLAELHALDQVARLAVVGDHHVALRPDGVVEDPRQGFGVRRRGVLHPWADPRAPAPPGEVNPAPPAAPCRGERDHADRRREQRRHDGHGDGIEHAARDPGQVDGRP